VGGEHTRRDCLPLRPRHRPDPQDRGRGSPTGVAYRDGVVWVAAGRSGNVLRIDASSGSAQPVVVGNEPTGVAIVGRDAWVTALPGSASHRGGTLRLALPAEDVPYSPDPTQFSGPPQWQLLSLASDGLVTYRKVGGLAGAELVPDLATTIPQPTDGGRTYTFRLREGIRYSNGARVQPADIRRGIERTMRSGNPYLASQYLGIVGTERCGPRACDLGRGIVTDREGGTVTFHLTRPDPDFLYKLAFSMASAVPAGKFGGKALPATGPYMTASFASNRTWVLVRNPWFHEWSRDAQPAGFPDRIVLKAAPPDQVAALEHGAADALLAPPLEKVDELARRYANQVHIDPAGATFPFVMNTRIPPFDRLAVRRALNYAIDRNRIARLTGSSLTAQPTCQVLPPNGPGVPAVLPVHARPEPERLVDGAGPRPGGAARRRLRNPGHKDHAPDDAAATGRADDADRPLRGVRARPPRLPRLAKSDSECRRRTGRPRRLEQAAADRLVQLAPGLPDAVGLLRAAAELPLLRPR
jgi:ABC-type transport system substrate-binding protein